MFEADVNQLPANKLGQGQTARPYPQFSGIGVGSGGSRTGLTTVFRTMRQRIHAS